MTVEDEGKTPEYYHNNYDLKKMKRYLVRVGVCGLYILTDAEDVPVIIPYSHPKKGMVVGGSAPHRRNSTGRIIVENEGKTREFYPQVCDLKWVPYTPEVLHYYGREYGAIGRGEYPWECTAKDRHPDAMIYKSPEGFGWGSEFNDNWDECSEHR